MNNENHSLRAYLNGMYKGRHKESIMLKTRERERRVNQKGEEDGGNKDGRKGS